MPSDVQVFVRFKEQCVFAGEQLSCIITFKNVAELPEPPTPGAPSYQRSRRESISQFANVVASQGRLHPNERLQNVRSPSTGRGERPHVNHQSSFSLSMPVTPVLRDPSPSNDNSTPGRKPSHGHQRSVSIISMNSTGLGSAPLDTHAVRTQAKPKGHRRSSTVQITGMNYTDLSLAY